MTDSEKKVWMDRIIYYADGRKEIQREFVPESWCKHDDGKCHQDDPCRNCPRYPAATSV